MASHTSFLMAPYPVIQCIGASTPYCRLGTLQCSARCVRALGPTMDLLTVSQAPLCDTGGTERVFRYFVSSIFSYIYRDWCGLPTVACSSQACAPPQGARARRDGLDVSAHERGALMVMVTPVVGIVAGCWPVFSTGSGPQSSWGCWRSR